MTDTLVRFTSRQRGEHLLVMALFTMLAVTGFPQKFYASSWSHGMVAVFGGIERLRWVHRTAGILFALLTAWHIVLVTLEVVRGKTRASLVPVKKDFTDAIVTLRYYLGLVDRQAAFDRFDYRQKFEYWGLLLGSMLMIVTGLILYLPLLAFRLLPGEFIPAAKVAHSNEGLMALLVIIIWHIYNAHLSPDVFPFDTSIFTGRISLHRMRHEHPLELERIAQQEPHAGIGRTDGEQGYPRRQAMMTLAAAPLLGALFVMFLPFVGVALVLEQGGACCLALARRLLNRRTSW
jgi:formate dehydrogenase subunit gamma